jgi:pilus assembly protein CpaC
MLRRKRTDSLGPRTLLVLGALSFFFCTAELPRALADKPRHADDTTGGAGEKEGAAAPGIPDENIKNLAIGAIDVIQDLPFEPNPSPVIGNTQIIKVDPGSNPREFRVSGQKKGDSSLIIYTMSGKIGARYVYHVTSNELSGKVLTIRRLLQDIEGITIESVDDKIVIDGELVVPRDLDRILQVQDAYKDVVFNLVTLSKLSREAIARRMQKEINDDPGGVNVTVRIINDTFFLFGKVDSSSDRDRAETIAQTYLPEMMGSPAIRENVISLGAKKFAIRNMIQVEQPPEAQPPRMVRITYHFVEIGKEYLKSSVFKWSPLLTEGAGIQIGQSTTGGVATQSNGSFSGTITSLIPILQTGANGGFSRILFSTVQMTEDKVKTELVRSEQIPFVGAVVNGVPVTSTADTGITVAVTPEIMGDKVRLLAAVQFKTAVGNGAGGQPRVLSTATQNQVILKSGESAALAGLIDSRTSKTVDKDPFQPAQNQTGNPLFTLLRSKAFSANKSQFVVFITPKIIEDASEGTADIKAKILNNSTKKRRRTIQ